LDVFNAIAEVRRREILDALMAGEKAVGTIVADLSLSQPPGVQAPAGAQRGGTGEVPDAGASPAVQPGARASAAVARVAALHEWLARYEQMWNERLDRMDDYLKELQRRGE
jgi:hypothetical protein